MVIGVVEGLSEVEDRTALTVTVAMLGLAVGVGLWWSYYDVLGRRVPSQNGVRLATWTYIHLPLTTSNGYPEPSPPALPCRSVATAVRPPPVLLAGALLIVLFLTWLVLIVQFFASGAYVDGADESG